MKSITNRLFVFAATAVFLGTTAFGQTTMRADVPFAFHVPGGGVDAGNYLIHLDNGGIGKIVTVYNHASPPLRTRSDLPARSQTRRSDSTPAGISLRRRQAVR